MQNFQRRVPAAAHEAASGSFHPAGRFGPFWRNSLEPGTRASETPDIPFSLSRWKDMGLQKVESLPWVKWQQARQGMPSEGSGNAWRPATGIIAAGCF